MKTFAVESASGNIYKFIADKVEQVRNTDGTYSLAVTQNGKVLAEFKHWNCYSLEEEVELADYQ